MSCLCNLFDDCEVWLWIAIIILIYHVLCCDNSTCGSGTAGNGGCGCGCGC